MFLRSAFLQVRDFVRSPEAMASVWTENDALAYTRSLATSHYENFNVVSFLLPKRLHQDFYNVYSYCRWADDLGDEMGGPAESLRLLEWWRGELAAMYEGRPLRHPVFVALRPTAERYGIPREPFVHLIDAFVQDQTETRYRTWQDLFAYCRNSANPVGRLVLYLCGYSDEARQRLSDATCTALQLANFWQDVTVDLEKDRIYLPLEALEKHGSSFEDVLERRPTPQFRAAMREAVDRAREFFVTGRPLARMVDARLSVDLELFSRGGLQVLRKIERMDYDVLAGRPTISKAERVGLLIGTLLRFALKRAA